MARVRGVDDLHRWSEGPGGLWLGSRAIYLVGFGLQRWGIDETGAVRLVARGLGVTVVPASAIPEGFE